MSGAVAWAPDAPAGTPVMPIIQLPRLLLQLLSLLLLAAAAYLLWDWWRGYDLVDRNGVVYHVHGQTWWLWTGLGLVAWSFGLGRFVVLLFIPGGQTPMQARAAEHVVEAPDGSKLHVEISGLAAGRTLILTHGWGLNSTAWGDAKQKLGASYRIIVWDLPGLGRSASPSDGVFTLDKFAAALGAVVRFSGSEPVVLVGHSIGGMTVQTFFRAASDELRRQVAGVVLVDTTYEDPIQTMWLSGLWRALKAPLIKPLMHLTIWLYPLVWLSSWQSYLSGSSQLVMRLTGFGMFATRGQVDLTARLAAKGSPAVQAKGNLAMLHWDVKVTLPTIQVPVLVLSGSKDIVTLPKAGSTIAAETPRGRFLAIEGCGHMGFMERHEIYNREIAAFAEGVLHPMPDV